MFRIFVHLQRLKQSIMNYFRNLEKLKSIFIASLAIIFSAFLFFVITWFCVAIQAVVSASPTTDGNGYGTFSTIRNAFSVFTGGNTEQQAGIYSSKPVESNFLGKNRIRKLIVDTDGSVDDAIAVFMIVSERLQAAQVLAITTVFGHTDVENATKNILRTLKVLGKDKDIPIYMGTTVGILKYPESNNEREYYFGYDGYGDTGYEGPSIDDLSKYHAVLAIIDALKKYPGEVTIFCTGPLTNIALAIRIYPEFVRDVRQIYILGGSMYRLDAMDTDNEFNFEQDPEALKIVFDPRIQLTQKIYFISWENVSNMKISLDWRVNVLGKMKSRKISMINEVEAKVMKLMKEKKIKQWTCPSAVLAAYYLKLYPLPIKPKISIPIRKFLKKSTGNNDSTIRLPKLNTTEFKSMLLDHFK